VDNDRRAEENKKTKEPPVSAKPVPEIIIYKQTCSNTESKVDKLGNYVIFEMERHKIKEIDVHRKVGKLAQGVS
jgi:hypothetical protein